MVRERIPLDVLIKRLDDYNDWDGDRWGEEVSDAVEYLREYARKEKPYCGHCGVKGVWDPSAGEDYHSTFIPPGGNYWCYGICGGYSFDPKGTHKTPNMCNERAEQRRKDAAS